MECFKKRLGILFFGLLVFFCKSMELNLHEESYDQIIKGAKQAYKKNGFQAMLDSLEEDSRGYNIKLDDIYLKISAHETFTIFVDEIWKSRSKKEFLYSLCHFLSPKTKIQFLKRFIEIASLKSNFNWDELLNLIFMLIGCKFRNDEFQCKLKKFRFVCKFYKTLLNSKNLLIKDFFMQQVDYKNCFLGLINNPHYALIRCLINGLKSLAITEHVNQIANGFIMSQQSETTKDVAQKSKSVNEEDELKAMQKEDLILQAKLKAENYWDEVRINKSQPLESSEKRQVLEYLLLRKFGGTNVFNNIMILDKFISVTFSNISYRISDTNNEILEQRINDLMSILNSWIQEYPNAWKINQFINCKDLLKFQAKTIWYITNHISRCLLKLICNALLEKDFNAVDKYLEFVHINLGYRTFLRIIKRVVAKIYAANYDISAKTFYLMAMQKIINNLCESQNYDFLTHHRTVRRFKKSKDKCKLSKKITSKCI